jgi:hypothetical protein
MADRERLFWKWEDEEDDGEGVGPWWVEDGPSSETWVRRTEAERLATDGDYEFVPDE